MFRVLKRSAIAAVGVLALAAASPTFACPSSNAIGNFKEDPNVGVRVLNGGNTRIYTFFSGDENPVGGVPGLIEYCVYPIPPDNPSTATALFDSWTTHFKPNQGYFSFRRPNGDPTNVPLDGSTDTIIIGTATWPGSPPQQIILLHVNEPVECDQLYGGNPGTCFVLPGRSPCPNGCG